jgi:hypothetical protein
MRQRTVFSARGILVGCGVVAAIVVAIVAQGSRAAEPFRIYAWPDRPGQAPEREEDFPVSGTGLIPFQSTDFVPIALGVTPSRDDGRPVAVLSTLPAGVVEQALLAPPFVRNENPKFIGYQVATVRYRLIESDVYVATLQPANLGLQRPLDLGRLRGDIGNGRQVYIKSGVLREGPDLAMRRTFNQVSFVENGLIVVISSELPADRLFTFAKVVSFTGRR